MPNPSPHEGVLAPQFSSSVVYRRFVITPFVITGNVKREAFYIGGSFMVHVFTFFLSLGADFSQNYYPGKTGPLSQNWGAGIPEAK